MDDLELLQLSFCQEGACRAQEVQGWSQSPDEPCRAQVQGWSQSPDEPTPEIHATVELSTCMSQSCPFVSICPSFFLNLVL